MHQRLLYTGNKPSNLLYISATQIGKDFKTAQHAHNNTEILFVTEGSGYIVSGDKKLRVTKGDTAIISVSTEHLEIANNLSVMEFYSIGIKDFYFSDGDETGIKVFTAYKNDATTMLNCFKALFDEIKRSAPDYEGVVCNLSEIIVAITCRYVTAVKGVLAVGGTSLVESAKRFLDNHFYADIKAEEIANSLLVSYSTLIHAFKKETGLTLTEYRLNRQLEETKSLLELTDMSINQIALNVGFSTNTYFSKIFKSKFNVTPKTYRELKKKNKT